VIRVAHDHTPPLPWLWGAVLLAVVAGQAGAAESAVTPAALAPQAGMPLVLELNLPAGPDDAPATWNSANVAQFFVRVAGEQRTLLPVNADGDGRHARLTIDRAGPALLCIGAGPPAARGHSDSWQRVTHCTKIVLDVRPADGRAPATYTPNPGITAKTGQKIEIMPMVDPFRLRVGDDLPVRVYYEGVRISNARVTATVRPSGFSGPGTEIQAARPTDAHGTTWLHVSRPGTWVVRLVHEVDGQAGPQRCVAELIFRVAEGGER